MNVEQQTGEVTYIVPDMGCAHCENSVSEELLKIAGVEAVAVDLNRRSVTVHGRGLDAFALQMSLETAGYQAA